MNGRRGYPRPADPDRPGPSARERVLRLLGRREYSRSELTTKLSRWGHAPEEIEATLDALAASDLQSDKRYAASQVRSRGAREGNRALRQRLGRQGVDIDVVDEAMTQLSAEGTRLVRLLERNKQDLSDPVKRNRIVSRWLRRGFSWDEVRQAMRAVAAGEVPAVDPEAGSL